MNSRSPGSKRQANKPHQPNDSGKSSENASTQKLQKLLAAAGFGSRRACEDLIAAGRVSIDGEAVTELGTRVEPTAHEIAVDTVPIRYEKPKYYLLNKPKKVICSNRDPGGRTRVIDLFPEIDVRLFTVGRLDENSQGLLLVTNDGDLAHRLAHPRFQVPRKYRALVAGSPNADVFRQLKQGMYFREGKFRVDSVKKIKKRGLSTLIEIGLSEGQNREIRRLLARVGHKVMQLERIQFGPLHLGHLATGRYRELNQKEVRELKEYAESRQPRARTGGPGADKPQRGGTRTGGPQSRSAKSGGGARDEMGPNRSKKGAPKKSTPKKSDMKKSSGNAKSGSGRGASSAARKKRPPKR